MISLKSNGSFIGAGLLAAFSASLCCITPIIALIAGSSSIASNFAWLEPARPYLLGLSIIVLGFAWYTKLKPANKKDMDCCKTEKPSFLQSKAFLGIVTVAALLMMTFPLYAKMFYSAPKALASASVKPEETKQVKFIIQGMTCAACEEHINSELSKVKGIVAYKTSYAERGSLVTYEPSKVDIKNIEAAINKTGYTVKSFQVMGVSSISTKSDIAYYEAPLVCAAAPSIGCGSKAKFMLQDLERNSKEVQGAWLNRKGTIIAIRWKENIPTEKKEAIITAVSSSHAVELKEASGPTIKDFPKGWYRGREVDQLSREEAKLIASNTINGYKEQGLVKSRFEEKFRADIEKIYTDLFLSISSYKELTTPKYNEIENKIQAAGEKYVGKGNMPKVELCTFSDDSCEMDKSYESGKSCCEKQ